MKKTFLLLTASAFFFASYGQAMEEKKPKEKFSFEKVKKKRYITTDEIGGLFGLGGRSHNKHFFTYQTVNAWQLDPHFYTGLGLGLEISGKNGIMVAEPDTKAALMLPIFWELRGAFMSKKVSPFFSQKFGYSFYVAAPKPGAEIIGGAMYQPSFGFKAYIRQQASFNFSVGYRLQCLAIPSSYSAQFNDIGLRTPDQVPFKTMEYYHFFVLLAGFTY